MFVCRACWKRAVGGYVNKSSAANACRALTTQSQIPTELRHEISSPVPEASSPRTPTSTATADTEKHSNSKSLEWAVNKQLEWLKDPFKIAEYVQRVLEKGRFEEAALITRKASRDARVTVSWNHIIDYQMRNQRLNAAIKLYNEVITIASDPSQLYHGTTVY